MQKLFIIQILRLWGICALFVILMVLSGSIRSNRSLFYLEHTRRDLSNTIWMIDTVSGMRFPILQRRDLLAFDLSADGNTIAYQVGSGNEAEIFLLGLNHPQHERIAAVNTECPKWSPDDRTLIYENYDDYSLYMLDVASREARLFLFLGSGIARCSYDWMPNGEALIHSDWPRPTSPQARLVRTDIQTGESAVLFLTGRPVRQLSVAPDGLTVTYDSQTYAGMMTVDTLTSSNVIYQAYTFSAAWSPTQDYIAFGYQKPFLNVRDSIVRGLAVLDRRGTIVFEADVGTISHISWWSGQ